MAHAPSLDPDRWRVKPKDSLDLAAIDTAATLGAPGDEEATEKASAELLAELVELQERLWAEQKQSLLVVLQAMDAGGKDGAIKKVFSGVNPQGVEVTSFKVPTEEEKAHDFLWRIHRATPRAGRIGIFNRSHYEDVLIVRVHGWIDAAECEDRYGRIQAFEENLIAAGTRIVKLFLHISKEEQAERFQKRLENPDKRWKFSKGDLAERERWDDYQAAFRDAIAATSTKQAPWFVIPADHKWYRDFAALSIIADALRDMDPQYPAPEEGLEGIVIT